MKIMFYALRPFDEQAYCEPYSKQYGIDYAYTAAVPTPDNLELAKGCDAVSTNPCLIAPEYLEAWAAMGVRFLPCRSIGYDHIPQQKAKELGMRISHSWYPPAGVADYAIMLMLMCNRKVGQILRRADAQDYSLSGKMGRDITRMTVGVIGTGNIGRTVLRHLSGFGCKLLAYDLYPNDEARQYAEYVDLDTLYKSCDIITLHTNATAANRHMIDANAIAKMKNGVVLINTARGTLIDPEALINGLESGKIGAAGLDVVENENGLFYFNHMGDALQNRELAMLRSFPNVIFTPHTAFYTDVNVASMVESAFKAVRAMAVPVLKKGVNLVIISIGAFADLDFYEQVKAAAVEGGAKVHLASGAIGGFDVLQTVTLMAEAQKLAETAGIETHTGAKGFRNTPVWADHLLTDTEKTTVFTGNAKQAIATFPRRVNVAVATSLATTGPEITGVTMHSVPGWVGDDHCITAEIEGVKAVVDICSSTSAIAGWSVVALLRNLSSPVCFY